MNGPAPGSPWDILALEPTGDQLAIRRAYARRLKVTNPEDDPDGFQALRQAYEEALLLARRQTPDEELAAAKPPQPKAAEKKAEPEATEKTAQPEPEPSAEPPPQTDLDAAVAHHVALCNHLGGLLSAPGAAPEPADPAALKDALAAVLASPALAHIDVQNRTEDWLARLLLSTAPRSDALVIPAIAHFRWDETKAGLQTPLLAAVRKRGRDLAFLDKLRDRSHAYATAYRLLQAPPARFSPRLRLTVPDLSKDVRGLIALIRHDYPSLQANFDADVLAAWDRYLGEEPVAAPLAWLLVTAPLFLLAYVGLHIGLPTATLAQWPTGFLLAGPLLAASGLAYRLGVQMPARWLRQRWARDAGPAARLGWAPFSLALIPLSLALPPSIGIPVTAAAATLALWWAGLFQRTYANDTNSQAVRILLANSIPLVFWLFWIGPLLPPAPMPAFTVAVTGALLATSIGGGLLSRWWYAEIGPARRRRGLRLLQVAAFAALGVLSIADSTAELLPWAVAAVTLVQILERVPSLALPAKLAKMRYYVLWGLGVVLRVAHTGTMTVDTRDVLQIGGLMLLASVLTMTIHQLRPVRAA
ncbi:J domain-containing protein [Nitrospirillum sp. BR 11828]|uniref:J domain-containing protein n=1 Tax=Nitrospirillum sp. BR 11828 TaxID=3104325 RepID=UPI002ACACD87|nr:J domain-containing protein [Nitrospirillum sp. BR 11828]MDZ5647789.1 J domain-containing protein [Nitrospirillum sp. BR 11828]